MCTILFSPKSQGKQKIRAVLIASEICINNVLMDVPSEDCHSKVVTGNDRPVKRK